MKYSLYIIILFFSACVSTKHFNPDKKYAAQELQQDYTLFRNVLEEKHPSLYWYTTKDSLDHYFDNGYARIKDSMTEPQFKTLLSYVISKIDCGHTSVGYSKKMAHYIDKAHYKRFPFSLKLWDDSAVVYENLNSKDTVLKRGTLIKTINHLPISFYRDSLFRFISTDGYNLTCKYQTLSNRSGFGDWYATVFGLNDSLAIGYTDSFNEDHTATIPVYNPAKDSSKQLKPLHRLTKKERKKLHLPPVNNVQIDSAGQKAILSIGTFSNGHHCRRLVRRTFNVLDKQHIPNLVIDVRNNGGGDVHNSTLLTKYIIDKPFKLADSLYAVNKRSHYGKYIAHYFRSKVFMTLLTRKRADGHYHFGYFERHTFKPKTNHHFNGNIYLITGGNSFSATALLVSTLKNQKNITIVGEETGGGSYGCSALLIPDVTLPNTKIRFRLPLFRLVENRNNPKTGRGIFPDVEARPTITDIRNGIDPKMLKVQKLIGKSY